jgi:hypothetical protein
MLPNLGTISLHPGASIMASQRGLPRGGSPGSKPEPWAKSKAKQLLAKLLADEASYIHGNEMDVVKIYNSDSLFKQYKIENFKTNYRNLASKIELERSCVEFDKQALAKEKQKFPRNEQTERGYKFWDGHEAQRLMREDVKEKRTIGMKPNDLRESRIEYKEFPLEILREHKYQEERRQQGTVYWQKKRNDEARKKHERYLRMNDV